MCRAGGAACLQREGVARGGHRRGAGGAWHQEAGAAQVVTIALVGGAVL